MTLAARLSQHAHGLDASGDHALAWTSPCRVATTADVTIATALNAGDTIDGIVLAAGDRVLVKAQTTGSQNGVYVAGPTPARAADYSLAEQIRGSYVPVLLGTANAAKVFRCTTTSLVVGTTSLTYVEWPTAASAASLAAVLAVGNDTNQISIIYDDLDFDSPAEVDISGPVIISGASLPSGEDGQYVDIVGGVGDGGASGGEIFVDGGEATGTGGNVEILSGAPRPTSDGDGGDVLVTLPAGDGTGRDGLLILAGLPTVDPVITDAIWTDGGVLVKSGSTAGGGGVTFVDSEVPAGTIDGVNAAFTLAGTPDAGSLHLYKNGLRQRAGAGNDYTLSGTTITYEAGNLPQTGDSHLADYRT